MKKIFTILVVLAVVVALVCIKPTDNVPYKASGFYSKQMIAVAKLEKSDLLPTDTVQIGWSEVNLQPEFTTPMAIDAKRKGKHYEGIRDSVFARAFVFRQGNRKMAYITADLLIIPPTVTAILDTLLRNRGYDLGNIFLSATHTHSSFGAWYPTIVGEIFAGKFDARVPMHFAQCMAKAVLAAEANAEPCKVGFEAIAAPEFVVNRLVHDSGTVDEYIRIVKFEKASGKVAVLATYSAHATIFHENMMQISADWPGEFVNELRRNSFLNFAAFSAGAVGSQGPVECAKIQSKNVTCMAKGLSDLVAARLSAVETKFIHTLNMQGINLFLREPNLRLNKYFAIRPWLFHWLFGRERVSINTFRLGDMIWVGLPCDFSGELVASLVSNAQKKDLNLIITSFNGGYIGYITDDRWYDLPTYETQTMGWFGPQTGAYTTEIVLQILEKI